MIERLRIKRDSLKITMAGAGGSEDKNEKAFEKWWEEIEKRDPSAPLLLAKTSFWEPLRMQPQGWEQL